MGASTRPEPPVPPDLDLRGFPYMPLHVARLRDSDLAVVSSGDEFRAAVLLWAASWHQVPASSLPCDDRLLAKLAGYGRDVDNWLKVKNTALRGFVECGDGLLYHSVIAETAMESASKKRKQQKRTEAATVASAAKRSADKQPPSDVRNGHQGNRIETEKEGADDARAREAAVSSVSIEIANELAVIAGHDPIFLPPGWCGAAMRVQVWMASDKRWTREVMLVGARVAMSRHKSPEPIGSVNFFERPIARVVAEQLAPIATVEPSHATPSTRDARQQPWQGRRDDWFDALGELDRHNIAGERAGEGGEIGNGAPLQITAAANAR